MNKNSRAHSATKNEHQFDKEKSELSKKICDVIEKHGVQEGAEVLADTFLRSEKEDAAEREKKQRKRKSVFIISLSCVVAWILFSCLFELIFRELNLNDILRKILQYAPLLVDSILVIVFAILKIVRMPESTRLRQDGEGFSEGMVEWVKDLWYQLSRASGIHILTLFSVIILVSTLTAEREPMKHISYFVSAGMKAMAHYDDNNNITDTVMLADDGVDRIYATSEMKQYLSDADEKLIEQLDNAEVTNEQSSMVLQLSDKDVYSLFTRWGNDSDGYGTQEDLNEAVLSKVREWCAEKRDNVFDREPKQGGAPQKDKDAISQASENEQPDDSFSDVEDRLDLRESIAKDYPKRTLVQLIANGYQNLALRLVWHKGVE